VSSDCDSGCVRTLDRVRLSHEKSLSLSLSRDVSVRVHTCSRARDCVRMRDRVDLLMVEDGWRARCGWRGKSSSNAMFPATDARALMNGGSITSERAIVSIRVCNRPSLVAIQLRDISSHRRMPVLSAPS